VVLRTWRRHDGPEPTTILLTHRPEPVTAREMGGGALRRWRLERRLQARQGAVGLGPQQGTAPVDRVEGSVAVALMASRLWRQRRAKDIPADRPWGAFRRQRAFAWEVSQAPFARWARQPARTWLQMGNAA
jgi:hypothetical protein